MGGKVNRRHKLCVWGGNNNKLSAITRPGCLLAIYQINASNKLHCKKKKKKSSAHNSNLISTNTQQRNLYIDQERKEGIMVGIHQTEQEVQPLLMRASEHTGDLVIFRLASEFFLKKEALCCFLPTSHSPRELILTQMGQCLALILRCKRER